MLIHKLDCNLQLPNNEEAEAIIYTNSTNLDLKNVQIIQRFPFINAVAVRGKLQNIQQLTLLNEVNYICSVGKIKNFDFVTDVNFLYSQNYNFNKNCKYMHKYTNNMYNDYSKFSGIYPYRVAVLDTGVANHIDLSLVKNRVIRQVDFVSNLQYNYDDNGHGTFVAGQIASSGILSKGKICGVVKNSEVVSIKIMDEKGESTMLQALNGMQWLADNFTRFNIKVVCMSFGTIPIKNDPLQGAVQSLYNLGLTVVCASGNSGENSFMSPAISPYVVSVGSVDNFYNISSFTSRGVYNNFAYPFIYAKGENVVGISNKSAYSIMSGTSVSCPIVCGYILRLFSKYPNLNPTNVKTILQKHCLYKNGIKIIEPNLIM